MLRYALTIFVSAFLLFQVQPLIGRFALPWFGGGPSIWTSCMLFFQLVLLAGYLYAHLLSTKLSIRSQVFTHVAMLTLSLLLLPIIPSDALKPVAGGAPIWQILYLLLATVGGPYFMLSSTGPLLQRWFSRTSRGEYPYRLYALSNVGSLLALLSYPFLFEPWMRLRQQAINWTIVYLGFVGLAVWCALRLWRQLGHEVPAAMHAGTLMTAAGPGAAHRPPGWWQMCLWLGLSASGSAMLLATTNQLCLDVAAVPFLWILPLCIYLLTFIVCFDNPRWYDRRIFGALLVIAAPAAAWVLHEDVAAPILDQIIIYSAVLFVCCMACHGEMVRSRPHPSYLTLYYMLASAGGAVGGLFVATVATNFFLGYWEYHIAIVASLMMILLAWCSQRVWLNKPVPAFWIWLIAVGAQLGSVFYFIYKPLGAQIAAEDRYVVFAIYALTQFVGLVLTVRLERKARQVSWIWIALTVLQMVWLGCYFQLRMPWLMSQRTYIGTATGIMLPTMFSLIVLWLLARRGQRVQLASMRVLFIVAVALYLTVFWYFRYFERWQIVALAEACTAALVLELIIAKLRGSGAKSWGLWFWIPAGMLLVLFGKQLIDVVYEDDYDITYVSRNFYGVLRVEYEDVDEFEYGEFGGKYTLSHGQIVHGFQFTDDYWRRQPTAYYGRESGVGLAIRLSTSPAEGGDPHPLRVGVVGLGTGSLAAYGKQGDSYRFYEINPDVHALSDKFFTYLTDSPADTQVLLGDARITLEREIAADQRQQFDVLAIDAFSGDAIPVHLLTVECGEIYRQHLRPGGILAVHISNRFLDLNPIARGLAEHLGWHAYRIENDDDDSIGVFSSTWILLTDSDALAENQELQLAHVPWDESDGKIQWSDDYSGLWRILSL